MKYTKFGNSGLTVSRLCLGCMSFGDAAADGHDWAMDEDASRPMIRQALEAGINFFDIANSYSGGTSEEITGRLLKEMSRRDEVVIATKAFFPWRRAPNTGGLSAKALMHAVDDSLRRLGTDYIDLYQIHRLDLDTPMEEILETLDAIVRSGKVRYIGASSMYAWQLMKMLHISELKGLKRFISMQNYVNLLYREEEREMLPLCADQGVAVMPWSPMARGKLTRPWDVETNRSQTDLVGKALYSQADENDRAVVDAVAELAEKRGLPMAQIALAWVLHKSEVTSPIIGATKAKHIEDAVAALDVDLSKDEIKALEASYVPHPVTGIFGMPKHDLEVSVCGEN
ncbi:aldo/keto reductase [Pontixanthobacter aestiaquae]|uniref:Aldo/keto reductase n=1 Tax=Pontixanthobacter aestiaquae TaxID=1509367 RepID=A0A844Z675_9SPHN|nr:aldo/keto reductase [Pontixanthobacter aestiaquae]MDN3646434.1 aldo/keto reductase [Pontixanthobacter aestiaquae]MXO82577.1 aldo/keto reductase [Pontixanthobacter aestiaquae]